MKKSYLWTGKNGSFFVLVGILPLVVLGITTGCGGGGGGGTTTSSSPTPTPTPIPTATPVLTPSASLTANTTDILRGGAATLTWSVANATELVSSNFGATALSGTVDVSPTESTNYVLTVRDAAGHVASATILVRVATVFVAVTPTPASVDISQTMTFTAQVAGATDTRVGWTVSESSGGTVSSEGVYTAPATAGVYHVQATSIADSSKVATVEVRVRASTGSVTIQ